MKTLLLALFVLNATIFASYIPLDRQYTSKNLYSNVLELQFQRLITDTTNTSFMFPTHNRLLSTKYKLNKRVLEYRDSTEGIGVTPLLDLEYRYLDKYNDHVKVIGIGGVVSGNKSIMRFMLDVRMFSEFHSNDTRYSYDREYIEVQEEGDNSTTTFSSYSRFKANFNLDLEYGKVGFSRSAVHWGPGLFHNLVFHQDAVPFNYFYYKGSIGPVRVMSLWGSLSIDGNGSFRWTDSTRSVYAHRYEWNVTPDLLLGVSEQLILYNMEEPSGLIPIVPLFMVKGQGLEYRNNGNIAMDLSYRFNNLGLIYSEFLIDDMSEPASLFNDFWKNKWAWMIGAQYVRDINGLKIGYITEYSRVEPWVYTHYKPSTAQSANHGFPLGNQLGPNSQAYTNKLYIRKAVNWYLGLRLDLVWKGNDYGSSLEDYRSDGAKNIDGTDFKKSFISGVGEPEIWITPEVTYTIRFCTISTQMQIKKSKVDYFLRALVNY